MVYGEVCVLCIHGDVRFTIKFLGFCWGIGGIDAWFGIEVRVLWIVVSNSPLYDRLERRN